MDDKVAVYAAQVSCVSISNSPFPFPAYGEARERFGGGNKRGEELLSHAELNHTAGKFVLYKSTQK